MRWFIVRTVLINSREIALNTVVDRQPIEEFYEAYRMSATRGMSYPQQLYPTVESLPCRSVEIPIWPQFEPRMCGENEYIGDSK